MLLLAKTNASVRAVLFFFLLSRPFPLYMCLCVYVSRAWESITGPVSGLLVDGSRTIDLS